MEEDSLKKQLDDLLYETQIQLSYEKKLISYIHMDLNLRPDISQRKTSLINQLSFFNSSLAQNYQKKFYLLERKPNIVI